MSAMGQISVVAGRDYAHERWLSFCAIAGLAAVLAPLLVLFGLKHGIVSTMIDDLRSRPEVRAIQPLGQGSYDQGWFAALADHPGVAFLMPSTRYLSATVELFPPQTTRQARPLRADMIPTGPGDPLWPEGARAEGARAERGDTTSLAVALSTPLAEKLGVTAGQTIEARLGRVVDGQSQAVRFAVSVAAVLPLEASRRDWMLVPPALLEAAEDYREGLAAPAWGWPGEAATPSIRGRTYASFRLYAQSLDDVAPLRDHLAAQGVQADTAAETIAQVRRLEQALTILFLVISTLAVGGYGVSLALSLVATVARKQQDLSVLKVLGFSNGAVALFPVIQASLTGLLGSLCALGLYGLAEPLINRLFAEGLRDGQVVCALLPEHALIAVAGTVAVSAVASILAGYQAAALPPAEGLRHE